MFPVDVKGLYRKNPWLLKRKSPRANLCYILAYVPPDEPNQFFVMTQQQATQHDYPVTGFVCAAESGCRDVRNPEVGVVSGMCQVFIQNGPRDGRGASYIK